MFIQCRFFPKVLAFHSLFLGWVLSLKINKSVACVCSSFEIEIVLEPSDSVLKLLQMGSFRNRLSICVLLFNVSREITIGLLMSSNGATVKNEPKSKSSQLRF